MYDHLKDEGKVFLEDEMIVYDQEILKGRYGQLLNSNQKLSKISKKTLKEELDI